MTLLIFRTQGIYFTVTCLDSQVESIIEDLTITGNVDLYDTMKMFPKE